MERTVTLREAAARLGVSPEALRKRISKGRLAAQREPGGRRRYVIPESALAELGAGLAGPAPAGAVRRLRVVGEGDVPAEAVPELVDLLRRQFEALRADRDRLVDELARLQGELDSAEVRTAALQAEIDRLRRRLAAAPGHFLSAIGRIQQDWNATP